MQGGKNSLSGGFQAGVKVGGQRGVAESLVVQGANFRVLEVHLGDAHTGEVVFVQLPGAKISGMSQPLQNGAPLGGFQRNAIGARETGGNKANVHGRYERALVWDGARIALTRAQLYP